MTAITKVALNKENFSYRKMKLNLYKKLVKFYSRNWVQLVRIHTPINLSNWPA
jgi:hypothetical protein